MDNYWIPEKLREWLSYEKDYFQLDILLSYLNQQLFNLC
jgi:hypothetical protein